MYGKELLYRWFKRQNVHVEIEHYLPEIQQRPDIFIERAGRKIAIEYQCANLSIEQLYKRTYSYWRAGIQVIWIIGGNQLKKAFCILDEIFRPYSFLLTILSSTTSYFLLFETKIIYEMRVSHFIFYKRLFLTYYIFTN